MRLVALLCLALLCSGCGTPQVSMDTGSRAWADPRPWSRYRTDSDIWTAVPAYGSPFDRPAVVCDRFGRCWRADPFDRRFVRGYPVQRYSRPPGWAERLPNSARTDRRFLRPRSNLVCDRATRICYKEGEIDKSDTERIFGVRAGDRADRLRDRYDEARPFVPERGIACDRERRICMEGGDPDRKLTRRYFGRQAACATWRGTGRATTRARRASGRSAEASAVTVASVRGTR